MVTNVSRKIIISQKSAVLESKLKHNLTCKDTYMSPSTYMHYATSRKVAGSILDEVIRVFNLHNTSSRTVTLGSTQPLTEMSTRNIPGGVKGSRRVRLTTLPPFWADCLENVGTSTSHNPTGLHGLL
jgi:hypothetical protein